MDLSERIFQLRKKRNMTQQALADQLGVSRQAISRWEMGTAKPELENLAAMSKLFGLSLDELITGNESAVERVSAEPEKKKKHGNRIWWILWAASFVVILAIGVIEAVVSVYSSPYGSVAFHPMTAIAQVFNLALGLGILALIIRFLCRMGKK